MATGRSTRAGSSSTRQHRQKRAVSESRLELETYNRWQQNRTAIRKWLAKAIAERAIQIYQQQRSNHEDA